MLLIVDGCSLITVITWIKKINSVDSAYPHFETKSFDPQYLDQPNNNILCLPIPGYGTRTETQNPDIPKGLTQNERDADHLVEAFAGWTLANATRLRRNVVITNCKNQTMLRRWKDWGHVSVLQVSEFVRSWKINEAAILEKLQRPSGVPKSSGIESPDAQSPVATPHGLPGQAPRTLRESIKSRDQSDIHSGPADGEQVPKHGQWRIPNKIQHPGGHS